MIVGARGDVVIERAYRDDIPHAAADAFRNEVVACMEAGSAPPVRLLDGFSFLSARVNEVYIIGACRTNLNAVLLLDFLLSFGRLLKCYLGEKFTDNDIRNRFSLVYELLDETMDFGYPQSCSVESLEPHISFGKPRARKELEKKNQPHHTARELLATGDVDWRRQGIKHKTNEIFLTITEQVSLLMSSDGTVLSAEVSGNIRLKSFLSGMPDCKLGLNDKLLLTAQRSMTAGGEGSRSITAISSDMQQVLIEDCAFHRCVRVGRFDSDRSITFIPPDGEFELMKYRISQNVRLPVKIVPIVEEIGRNKVLYNIRVAADVSKKRFATGLVIRIPCPSNTAKTKISVSKGRAKYDVVHHAIVWRIKRLAGEAEATLSCTAQLSTVTKSTVWSRPPIEADFVVPMVTASGLAVRYLRVVEKSTYSAEKWVKYSSRAGSYQIRI